MSESFKTLEQIQKRAARFVTNAYQTRTPGCVTPMQKKSGMGHTTEETARQQALGLYAVHDWPSTSGCEEGELPSKWRQ